MERGRSCEKANRPEGHVPWREGANRKLQPQRRSGITLSCRTDFGRYGERLGASRAATVHCPEEFSAASGPAPSSAPSQPAPSKQSSPPEQPEQPARQHATARATRARRPLNPPTRRPTRAATRVCLAAGHEHSKLSLQTAVSAPSARAAAAPRRSSWCACRDVAGAAWAPAGQSDMRCSQSKSNRRPPATQFASRQKKPSVRMPHRIRRLNSARGSCSMPARPARVPGKLGSGTDMADNVA